jgi:transposase
MRVTTLLRRMLGVPELFVRSVGSQGNDLIVGVVPRWRKPRCGRCGRPAANNKLRMIARRAFGFHSPPPLISMLYLCCGGITLDPPLPGPT